MTASPSNVRLQRAYDEPTPGWLFVSACQSDGVQPLSMNAVSLMLTRRYARQTPDALGRRAADALARAGLVT